MRVLGSGRVTVGLLLAVAAAIVASNAVVGVARGQAPPRINNTALMTTNRPGLKICVQSLVAGVDTRTIQGRIQGAMTSVANHPDYQRSGLGRQPLVVDTGCPAPPTIADPSYRPDMLGAPARVTEPSQYLLFVFIATPEQLASAFSWQPRLVPQELLCDGDVCNEVTGALYLTPTELTDRAILERGLTQGVGLWPVGRPGGRPPFDPVPRAPAATPGRP
jgi:hypothetical protein